MPSAAPSATVGGGGSRGERLFVGKRSQFTDGARQLVKCGTRNIAVVCHRDQLYAIDNACYHHGGPLLRGDIEEMGGHPCIICPWHSYRIALDTGEGLYMGIALQPGGGPPQQTVKSKGCKQRVHPVTVDDKGDVYVTVDLSGPRWESDAYASMELANRERPTRGPMEGDGAGPRGPGIHSNIAFGVRSGQVFQQMGLANTGRGGTNPFNARQRTRPPVSPTLLSSNGSHSPTGVVTNLFVACTAITDVCAGVKEFHFSHHSGPLLRHAELGEHVELELPLKETIESSSSSSASPSVVSFAAALGEEVLMRRRWTICDVNHKGSLFTLMVKAAGTDPQRSGSAWLHQRSLHTPLRVCGVGGTFTFADHHDTIRRLRGNMLWVTAGIGITSAYAAMNSSLDDTFFAEGSEPLHVVHLHANRTLDSVPKLDTFIRWQRRFPRETSSQPQSSSSVSSDGSAGGRSGRKTYVMELFISPPKGGADGDARGRHGATSPLPHTDPITHRHHLHATDIMQAVQTYFGSNLPLAYVCGPPHFVSDCSDALMSAGLPEAHILTDDV